MTEEKYQGPGPQARVHKRLENSGAGAMPNHTIQKGDGPNRCFTNIHSSGHYVDPSTAARECDPQHQRHADEATQQTTSYFRGHGKHNEVSDD